MLLSKSFEIKKRSSLNLGKRQKAFSMILLKEDKKRKLRKDKEKEREKIREQKKS